MVRIPNEDAFFCGKELVVPSPCQIDVSASKAPCSVSFVPDGNEGFGIFRGLFLAKLARITSRSIAWPRGSTSNVLRAPCRPSDVVRASFVATPPFITEDEAPRQGACLVANFEVDAVRFTKPEGTNWHEIEDLCRGDSRSVEVDIEDLYALRLGQNIRLQLGLAWVADALASSGWMVWNTGGDSLLLGSQSSDSSSAEHLVRLANASMAGAVEFRLRRLP